MEYHISPITFPLLVSAAVTLMVMVYAWIRRADNPGGPALTLIAAAMSVWTLTYALELAGAGLTTKLVWGRIQYFGIVLLPYGWFVFTCDHGGIRIRPKARLALLLLPMITLILALTADRHTLIWRHTGIVSTGSFSVLKVTHGLAFWIFWVYSYSLLFSGTVIILRSLGRLPGLYIGQTLALLIGIMAPWLGNVIYLTGLGPVPLLDLTPFAFTITVLALAWAIFGFQLVNLSPIARDVVVEQMQDGLIVIDGADRINDINPKAQAMIGLPAYKIVGHPVTEVLDRWSDLVEQYRDKMEAMDEFVVETDHGRT
jgi:PAS domain-containing protein